MTLFRLRGPVGLLLMAALLLPAASIVSTPAFAEGEEGTAEIPWEMDWAKAKAKAKAENKDLLINFTGSDWCGWCKKLEGEVFHHQSFLDTALKGYVMVFLDFPNAEELKAKVVDPAVNEKLKNAYGVQGFPTIMLTNADGHPYGRTGYQEGGPEGYLKHLDELKASGKGLMDLLAAGDKATKDQLKAGAEALVKTGTVQYPDYNWIIEKAKVADKDNWLGLKETFLRMEEEQKLKDALPKTRNVQPDWPKIAKLLKESKYLQGGMFLNVGYGCAKNLLMAGNTEDAKAIAALLKRDPLYSENEQAKGAIDGLIKEIDDAIAAAKDAPAEDGGK